MTHLLHEVKEELDWAARELLDVEQQFAELEAKLKSKLEEPGGEADRDALTQEIEAQKKALNLNELYAILARATRRFSLLARVYEVGSDNNTTEDIVTALTDGLLFHQNDTDEKTDKIIFRVADALMSYFHVHFSDESDARLRDAWLEVENTLREKGRKI
ncbi:MAG: hypothetical protein OQK24_04910 [Magnetovibrio sp.]|nr:hypothetical protein [Magnetovibrio sp.]